MAKQKQEQQASALGFMQGQAGNVVEDSGDNYPLLQWYNGKPSKSLPKTDPRVTGGFFYKVEDGEKFPVGALSSTKYGNGETAKAYAVGGAHIAVIAERVDWYTGDKNSKPTWHDHYEPDKQMKGRNRFLVYLRGAEKWHEEHGPLMISLYGVNGLILARDVVGEFRKTAHKAAERLAGGAKLDAYTFFVGVAPDERQKASKDFASMITPPKLDLSIDGVKFSKADPKAFLEASFIGGAGMALCNKFWGEAQEWRKVRGGDELLPDAVPLDESASDGGNGSAAFSIDPDEE